MSDANKQLIRRFLQRVNAGDLAVVDEFISEDFVEHEEIPGLPATKAGVRQMFEMFQAAFADAQFVVDDVIADGDIVSVRAHLTGRHRAEFMGVPASDNNISVGLADYFRVDDGILVEHWGVMDSGALMRQLAGH
jgi:steroid delta-isomerase-like uncharacterized protein